MRNLPPLICSAGGIPYNKPHLDDLRERLDAALEQLGRTSAMYGAKVERMRAALKQAVDYADVAALEDGMPEGKQATRITATWLGKDIRYAALFDVKAARDLIAHEQSEKK